jgi:hypothetical protein
MRYLKSGSLRGFNPQDRGFSINPRGRIDTNSTDSLRIPAGTTAQRPDPAVVKEGVIRYNTDTNSVEGYLDGLWEVVKGPTIDAISTQTISGFFGETLFGPLDKIPAAPQNIFVLVENVLQIHGVNFTIQNIEAGGASPSRGSDPYEAGLYIQFTDGESVPTGLDITVVYGFDA